MDPKRLFCGWLLPEGRLGFLTHQTTLIGLFLDTA